MCPGSSELTLTVMPTIDVNNTSIYYERTGEGPPILFIHGMCGHADVWADQAERLSDRYTCVRYDRRGHTRSARGSAPVSTAIHADDAAALIEALELAPCLLVSSSGGAVIGVDVAMRHGDRLRGAVFSEPPLFRLDDQARDAAIADLGPIVGQAASGDLRSAVDAFFSLMCPGLWSRIDESRKDSYRANAEIGFTDVRSQTLQVTPAELAAVSVPALVIAGDASHPALRSIARCLAAGLSDARFIELADCGHVTYAEQPEAFARVVSTFAAELDRRAAVATGQVQSGPAL
jgi:3-oxoadipate enol-lactonase